MMMMMMIIIIVIISIIYIISKAQFEIFYNLLTAPRTVYNTYAQVARAQIVCKSRATHRALITCNISYYVPLGTKGQLSYLIWQSWNRIYLNFIIMAGMPRQKKKKKKKKKDKKGKADLTTVLVIRELPHVHMKLTVWFSFPTRNNKNPMISSWSLVSIYNYSFNPDQIFTKNFEILELEICSKIFTCGMIFFQVNISLPTSLKKKCVKPLNLVLCQSRNLS